MKKDILYLKEIEKEMMPLEINKLYEELQNSRGELLKTLIHTTNKKAFFTVDSLGKIKRKEKNHMILGTLFVEKDQELFEYYANNIDFSEQEAYGEEKISRIKNMDISKLEKNLIKVIFNGKLDHVMKYSNELYMRDEKKFYEILTRVALMDNINHGKALYLYGMKKYFEIYSYSIEILYFVMSYITKMRIETYEYENAIISNEVTLEELMKDFKNKKDKLENEEGLNILGSLKIIENLPEEERKIYLEIIKNKITVTEKNNKVKELNNIGKEIFAALLMEIEC